MLINLKKYYFIFLLTLSFALHAESFDDRWQIVNDVVYDNKTDLSWQRCTVGQIWDEKLGCNGTPSRLTFDDAKLVGQNGWRMPTLDELVTIVVLGQKPSINLQLFPNTPPAYYWATDNRDLSASWYVFFENGRVNHYFPPRTNTDMVRLVKNGKPLATNATSK